MANSKFWLHLATIRMIRDSGVSGASLSMMWIKSMLKLNRMFTPSIMSPSLLMDRYLTNLNANDLFPGSLLGYPRLCCRRLLRVGFC